MVSDSVEIDEDWIEWYKLTPQERWRLSQELWDNYLYLGGSLDPEPDTQSPFFDPATKVTLPINGRSGMRIIRGI